MRRFAWLILLPLLAGCQLLDSTDDAFVLDFDRRATAEDTSRAALERAQDAWQRLGGGDYRFTYYTICYCPAAPPVEVVVRDGVAQPYHPPGLSRPVVTPPTLTELLDQIAQAFDDGQEVHARYDVGTGLLAGFAVNSSQMPADAGIEYRIQRLVLPR